MRIYRHLIISAVTTLLFISCKKDNASPSKYPFYFIGKVNSKEIRFEADDLTTLYKCIITSSSNNIPPYVIQYEGTSLSSPNQVYTNQIYVNILKKFDHTPQLSERKAMWKAGNFNYGVGIVGNNGPSFIDGVSILYIDENTAQWFSEQGPQSGSTFTVTEMWSDHDATVFKAIFSCKLYDDVGHSIKIENAEISGRLFTP